MENSVLYFLFAKYKEKMNFSFNFENIFFALDQRQY